MDELSLSRLAERHRQARADLYAAVLAALDAQLPKSAIHRATALSRVTIDRIGARRGEL